MRKKPVARYIVADPLICHGQLTFKGTRIMVDVVLELVAEGMDWDEIIRGFHDRISRPAIVEAIRLANWALVKRTDEQRKKAVVERKKAASA